MIGSLPIRWRLTLWYASLTTFVLLSFSIAVYIGLERQLSSDLDEDLRSQAALASNSITFGAAGPILASEDDLSDEALLKVMELDGRVVLNIGGDELVDVPPRLADIARAASGQTTYRTIHVEDQTLRVLTVPIRNQQSVVIGALLLGVSTERIDEALDLLVQALFVIAPVAIVLAAGTGYMLAGRALRPVADITRLAGQIGGNDLHSRLNLDLPNDELGRLASTFDSMLARIEDAFQRQRQFTGDAAHELRTPLALMRSQIDLALTQADTPDELRDALQALDGDVGQMTTLVGTLLALARADAGALTPSREPVDLADLASDVCDQYAPIASQNGLTLTCVARPVGVQADADMVIQVIVNLVDNAIKNTPEGGTITIRTGRGTGVKAQETGGGSSRESRHDPQIPDTWPLLTLDSAFVQVTDTGVGIPAEHLPRIFDRFYRVDAGRTRNKGGIGLGLAISQSIAQVHGGTLSAASAPGKGSTFTLTLPA